MNPLAKHARSVLSPDILALADALEAMAQETADWKRVCARLLPRVPRESLNVAERVILDVALEKLRASGGAVVVGSPDSPMKSPPLARSIEVVEREMTDDEARLF